MYIHMHMHRHTHKCCLMLMHTSLCAHIFANIHTQLHNENSTIHVHSLLNPFSYFYIYTYTDTCTFILIYSHMYIYNQKYTYLFLCMAIHISLWDYMCKYIQPAYTYAHAYVYICTNTPTIHSCACILLRHIEAEVHTHSMRVQTSWWFLEGSSSRSCSWRLQRETLNQEPLPTSPSFTPVPTSFFVLLFRLKESPWKGQVKDRQPQPSTGLEWIKTFAALLAACPCSQVWWTRPGPGKQTVKLGDASCL